MDTWLRSSRGARGECKVGGRKVLGASANGRLGYAGPLYAACPPLARQDVSGGVSTAL